MYASNLCMPEYDATVSGRIDDDLLKGRCPLRILYFLLLNTVIEKLTLGSSLSVRDVTVIQSGFSVPSHILVWNTTLQYYRLSYFLPPFSFPFRFSHLLLLTH